MKDRVYTSLWWSMRIYLLMFAGFIAAFGAVRWPLPARRGGNQQPGQGGANQLDHASAADPTAA